MTKTQLAILSVLGIIIVVSLVGIGILGVRLLSGTTGERATTGGAAGGGPITLPEATPAPLPGPTSTLIPAPSLTEPAPPPAPPRTPPAGPVIVARQESSGPFAVAVLAGVPLLTGHRYRLEVSSPAGSVGFHGSWSQSAMGADGTPGVDSKLIEGVTPSSYDVVPPVANPTRWKCSASVQNKGEGGIVLTVWDVSGVK